MHKQSHIRNSFADWVDEGTPPLAAFEVNHEPVTVTAEKLLGQLWHGTDTMPGYLCDQLSLERGSTYARAARTLMAERRRATALAA
jgi:hypothetical protein